MKENNDKRFRKKIATNIEIKLRVTANENQIIRKKAEGYPSLMDYIRGRIL